MKQLTHLPQSSIQLTAMTILAPLTKRSLMRTFTLTRVTRPIHLNPTPLFKTIRHPLRIRPIQTRLSQSVAFLTTLIVYPRVVLCSPVHTDRDGDPLTRPSVGVACVVAADEAAHDVGVVFFGAVLVVVLVVKVEVEVVFFEQVGYIIVQARVHGP